MDHSSQWESWPNKARGEVCTRDLETYDEYLRVSPFLTDRQDESTLDMTVKSSLTKDDDMQLMIISSLVVFSEKEMSPVEERRSGYPLIMWRFVDFCLRNNWSVMEIFVH